MNFDIYMTRKFEIFGTVFEVGNLKLILDMDFVPNTTTTTTVIHAIMGGNFLEQRKQKVGFLTRREIRLLYRDNFSRKKGTIKFHKN